jgi:hypothetical protein
MKNSSDAIGNRTRDLPVCSAVPQPLCYRVPHPSHAHIGYWLKCRHEGTQVWMVKYFILWPDALHSLQIKSTHVLR